MYFVAAELSKRGYAVAMTIGNAKAIDIFAEEGRRTACIGAAGGKATTDAKREASRLNGAKGGRPRKARKEALP